jgi:methionyl-tRNA formyltransferase
VTAEPGATGSDRGPARRARTVFFGSGAFGVPILDATLDVPEIEVVAVVSAPDRPVGRRAVSTSSPVATRARELGLALLQPERLRAPDAVTAIAELRPDLGLLADYGQIVPPAILELPPHGILNVHPSPLPRHRGATPIPATILAGDEATAVALIRMDEGLDTGPIVAGVTTDVHSAERAPELEARLAGLGADLVRRFVGRWVRGELPTHPQPDDGATLTRPLRREDGRLDPTRPAAFLERQIRAYDPWPGSWLETTAGRIAVRKAHIEEDVPRTTPGQFGPGPDLRIGTADGWLVLDEVQPAGGRRMSGESWLRGRPAAAGSSVG